MATAHVSYDEPELKKGRSGTDRPSGSSLTLRRARLVAWLCARAYVAYTTTDFVWISSRGSMVGLFSPSGFARHVSALCFPVRKPLTLRVSFWTHWKSLDRDVPGAVVVPLDLWVSRYRRLVEVALHARSGRSPSDDLGLANRRDWTSRRLSSCLSPWFSAHQRRVLGCASCGSDGSCRTSVRCRWLSPRVQRPGPACSGRRVQSRF